MQNFAREMADNLAKDDVSFQLQIFLNSNVGWRACTCNDTHVFHGLQEGICQLRHVCVKEYSDMSRLANLGS